jgi:MFS family permease
LLNGATVFVYPGSAAVTGLIVGRISPRSSSRLGGACVVVGATLVTVAISAKALPLLLVGALVGGVGFGASFSGSLRTITSLVEPARLAGVFAALFSVAYLAFGLPVIIAGQLVPRAGLLSTVVGYGIVTAVAATAGLIAQSAAARRDSSVDVAESRSSADDSLAIGWPGCSPSGMVPAAKP